MRKIKQFLEPAYDLLCVGLASLKTGSKCSCTRSYNALFRQFLPSHPIAQQIVNRLLGFIASIGVSLMLVAGVAAQELPERVIQPDETAAGFDLDRLIEAARQGPGITIYDQTGKVVSAAKNFTEKYGVPAVGVKIELGMIEKAAREAKAGNVIGDVVINSAVAEMAMELLADGDFFNWVPGDMAAHIEAEFQYPLQLHFGHYGWVYNDGVYDTCPVDNLWQLTEDEFRGRSAMVDPLANAIYTNWFNMMARNDEAALRALYKERYGEDLRTDEPTAAHEWVKRFASNGPKIFRSSEEVSEAVGAPGQEKPAFGPVPMAKFRNITGKGYRLAICDTLRPWALQAFPSAVAISRQSKNIAAAKLFVHYLFTEEGFADQLADGKVSSNKTMALPQDPSNVASFLDIAAPYRASDMVSNYETRVEWDDFWRLHYR